MNKIVVFATYFLVSLSQLNNLGYAQTKPVIDENVLYQQHCQTCHGKNRLGGHGPALLPGNLSRLKPVVAEKVINDGRPATQMPGFSSVLNQQQVTALVKFIYQPPTKAPQWNLTAIKNSHRMLVPTSQLPKKPTYQADIMNLFVVVESGDHHVTILNGDTFTPIHRFKSHYALHGGPKFSPDGRFVYFASRDGWVSKFDLYSLQTTAEVRVGLNTRNLAASADGYYLMAANYLPNTLVLLNSQDLSVKDIIPVSDGHGKPSRVSAVYTAPPRNSFIVALKDVKEVWEIPYNQQGANQLRQLSVLPEQSLLLPASPFTIKRIPVTDYLDDFFFDANYQHLVGTSRETHNGNVIQLDQGKKIASIPLTGLPHLGSGIYWTINKQSVMATPNIKKGIISIIDINNWKVIKEIPTEGPGFFIRSHKNSPYAWADVFFGPNKEKVHIIDKQQLEIIKTLAPMPGKNAAHVEFSKDGRYALLSVWDMDGALIVYDAKTLQEIKRLPMKKPSGKYNVYNKTHYAEGTSH
ncbi:cytochrome D1 domain-containing protein [Spartinivicinus marinus]|uniref:cytochrome D1 domain-containing protein n=1 Tax=Spartinivicinus marinus TaxID=2994442 RepID=UPI003369E339